MIIFVNILFILMILASLVCVFLLMKNDNTYRNHGVILDAIFSYKIAMIEEARENGTILNGVNYEVDYSDMKSYNDTLKQIFDWGYDNILPKDKFEIIKPYIHKKNGG